MLTGSMLVISLVMLNVGLNVVGSPRGMPHGPRHDRNHDPPHDPPRDPPHVPPHDPPQDSGSLQVGFYARACPTAEEVVRTAVLKAIALDVKVAAGLLRLFFHDCFVEGCDASVLIDSVGGNSAEKDAEANRSLNGFAVIDDAKAAVESTCPGQVSCADILAFAARDSVFSLGGPDWQLASGRRDGTVSQSYTATANIPSPTSTIDTLLQLFHSKGLSSDDLITLTGSHTIGSAHCAAFNNRLYNFSQFSSVDPSLDSSYAQQLQALCPIGNGAGTANMDPLTSFAFDNQFYRNLLTGRALLTSDQQLLANPQVRDAVTDYARPMSKWKSKFTEAFNAMGKIGVKTGTDGQIRNNCRVVNTR